MIIGKGLVTVGWFLDGASVGSHGHEFLSVLLSYSFKVHLHIIKLQHISYYSYIVVLPLRSIYNRYDLSRPLIEGGSLHVVLVLSWSGSKYNG